MPETCQPFPLSSSGYQKATMPQERCLYAKHQVVLRKNSME